MDCYPGISLWQPWASLLVHGIKKNETRSWSTKQRGKFYIHAASKWTGFLQQCCLTQPMRKILEPFGVPPEPTGWDDEKVKARRNAWGMPLGAIVGYATLKACLPTGRVGKWDQSQDKPGQEVDRFFDDLGIMGPSDGKPYLFISDRERALGDYGPGRWAWVFTDPVLLADPVPFVAKQGIFRVPEGTVPE